MSKKFDQRLLDTNALVMGGGVGLAALESMFNLVQTQSLLSAGMVKHHDLSHGLALEALALAIGEVLDPGVYSACRSCRHAKAVKVDIPAPQASPPADAGTRRGALANADVLADMARDSQTETTTTTHTTEPDVSMDKHLTEIFALLSDHLKDITKNTRSTLMVT